jgi:hypothetical protein
MAWQLLLETVEPAGAILNRVDGVLKDDLV